MISGRVEPASSGNFGKVTLAIDGKPVVTTAIPISLSSPKGSGIEFGLTYAAETVVGKIALDDLSFQLTP